MQRHWSISLAAHTSVVVANIDFQKAFDTVSHTELLHKLSGYGIHGISSTVFHHFYLTGFKESELARFCQTIALYAAAFLKAV